MINDSESPAREERSSTAGRYESGACILLKKKIIRKEENCLSKIVSERVIDDDQSVIWHKISGD